MKGRIRFSSHIFITFILLGSLYLLPLNRLAAFSPVVTQQRPGNSKDKIDEQNKSLSVLYTEIIKLRSLNNIPGIQSLADSLISSVEINSSDSAYSADICYYIGACELLAEKHSQTVYWLEHSLNIKEKLKIRDAILAKTLFNLALSYNNLGDYDKVKRYALGFIAVSYTHLRAHETVLDLVCRLLL